MTSSEPGVASEPTVAPGSALILGGTAEARALASAVTSAGLPVISSLAGRVSRPALPVGRVRIGGFGGVAGLTEYLQRNRFRGVVDATHPFAATISASAAIACAAANVPLLRLARPGWGNRRDAADWHWVDSVTAACLTAMELGQRAFLTTGRQSLGGYAPMAARYALVRVVEPPTDPLPVAWEVIRDRGPYSPAGELDLMRSRRLDVLVTKDSGGDYTSAKLDAARRLGLDVVVVRRPAAVDAGSVDTVEAAVNWLGELTFL